MNKKLDITILGETEEDLGHALDEIKRLVLEGFLLGRDSNDTGKYSFAVTANISNLPERLAIESLDNGFTYSGYCNECRIKNVNPVPETIWKKLIH